MNNIRRNEAIYHLYHEAYYKLLQLQKFNSFDSYWSKEQNCVLYNSFFGVSNS